MTQRERRLSELLTELLRFVQAPSKVTRRDDGQWESTYVNTSGQYNRLTEKCRSELQEIAAESAAVNVRRGVARRAA